MYEKNFRPRSFSGLLEIFKITWFAGTGPYGLWTACVDPKLKQCGCVGLSKELCAFPIERMLIFIFGFEIKLRAASVLYLCSLARTREVNENCNFYEKLGG